MISKSCKSCGSYKKMTKNKGLCSDLKYSQLMTNILTTKKEHVLLSVHNNLICEEWRPRDEYNKKIRQSGGVKIRKTKKPS